MAQKVDLAIASKVIQDPRAKTIARTSAWVKASAQRADACASQASSVLTALSQLAAVDMEIALCQALVFVTQDGLVHSARLAWAVRIQAAAATELAQMGVAHAMLASVVPYVS